MSFATRWVIATIVVLVLVSVIIYLIMMAWGSRVSLVKKWLGITLIAITFWSIIIYDPDNPETGWYASLFSMTVYIFSFIIMVIYRLASIDGSHPVLIKTINLPNGYSQEQSYYFRRDGNMELLHFTRIIIENENSQQNFENLFNVKLAKTNFTRHYLAILPSQKHNGGRNILKTQKIDPNTINIYQLANIKDY